MLIDKLKINDDKTEFMIIGTKQQLAKISPQNLTIGKATVTTAKNLATRLDYHRSYTAGKSKQNLQNCIPSHSQRHIRKYLTKDVTEKLVHAFVIGIWRVIRKLKLVSVLFAFSTVAVFP